MLKTNHKKTKKSRRLLLFMCCNVYSIRREYSCFGVCVQPWSAPLFKEGEVNKPHWKPPYVLISKLQSGHVTGLLWLAVMIKSPASAECNHLIMCPLTTLPLYPVFSHFYWCRPFICQLPDNGWMRNKRCRLCYGICSFGSLWSESGCSRSVFFFFLISSSWVNFYFERIPVRPRLQDQQRASSLE